MKLCFLRAHGGGKTGPGILLTLRSEYETKRKRKKKEREKESEGREAGEGFAACFGRS